MADLAAMDVAALEGSATVAFTQPRSSSVPAVGYDAGGHLGASDTRSVPWWTDVFQPARPRMQLADRISAPVLRSLLSSAISDTVREALLKVVAIDFSAAAMGQPADGGVSTKVAIYAAATIAALRSSTTLEPRIYATSSGRVVCDFVRHRRRLALTIGPQDIHLMWASPRGFGDLVAQHGSRGAVGVIQRAKKIIRSFSDHQ